MGSAGGGGFGAEYPNVQNAFHPKEPIFLPTLPVGSGVARGGGLGVRGE